MAYKHVSTNVIKQRVHVGGASELVDGLLCREALILYELLRSTLEVHHVIFSVI